MIVIRPYEESDYGEICSWWLEQDETPPYPGMMVNNGTFVLEYNGERVMTLTALMTQSKQISYLEGFCSKPGLNRSERNKLSLLILSWCIQFLKENHFKRTVILTHKLALKKRYQELGMTPIMRGLYSLGKEF